MVIETHGAKLIGPEPLLQERETITKKAKFNYDKDCDYKMHRDVAIGPTTNLCFRFIINGDMGRTIMPSDLATAIFNNSKALMGQARQTMGFIGQLEYYKICFETTIYLGTYLP